MVLRRDQRGVLAISQAAHAWICGQLALAWGNDRIGDFEPRDEVALGATRHDDGMAAWDLSPQLNPATGLPRGFTEMVLSVSLAQWRAGPRSIVAQSRYAALLAAMHGRRLYQRLELEARPRAEVDAIRAYLTDQHRLEAELLRSLRADPVAAAAATPDRVTRNSQLVWTWDVLSLALCLDWAPHALEAVPAAEGELELRLEPTGEPLCSSLDPWPFATPSVTVHCEGRRLAGAYETQGALSAAWAAAPWETLRFSLVPLRWSVAGAALEKTVEIEVTPGSALGCNPGQALPARLSGGAGAGGVRDGADDLLLSGAGRPHEV
jgi:hypothetical protein